MQFERETVERLARLETKMDIIIADISTVKTTQKDCPARKAYLSEEFIKSKNDKSVSRLYGFTGWIVAIIAGLVNLSSCLRD